MTNITLFSQIISIIDRANFKKLVKKHNSDKHQKGFGSWSHLVSMLFSQFANSQSLRDISNGLRSTKSLSNKNTYSTIIFLIIFSFSFSNTRKYNPFPNL